MSSTIKIAVAVIVALFIFAGIGIVGLNSQKDATDGSTANAKPNLNATEEKDVAAVITYTGKGFEPDSSSVDANSQVRIRNRSIRLLKFVSDPYLEESDNQELNVGEIKPGETKTFYVSQSGRWGYHNALDPSETGTLIVR